MRKELDDKLVAAFPKLYADRHSDMRTTCMCWGFDVGDGWFQIVWDLSEKLEAIINQLPEKSRDDFRASQVKEKFGGLRFYMTSETDEISNAINEAEERAWKTCELCGSPGKTNNNGGWLRTRCDACRVSGED